jgi:hypothetical protein
MYACTSRSPMLVVRRTLKTTKTINEQRTTNTDQLALVRVFTNQQPTNNKQQTFSQTTNNKQQTTNNEQQTTNNEQQTTNNKQRTTNNKQQTTNNEQQTTNNKHSPKQQTTNDEQRTTNNKQQTFSPPTTNDYSPPLPEKHSVTPAIPAQ